MTTCSIRVAVPSDLPALRSIQQAALEDPAPDLLAAAVEGPLQSLVCVDASGTIVGYVTAVTAEEQAYLPELAVSPPWQGQGVETQLLEAICHRCASAGSCVVRLTARASAARVRQFYEHRGFTAVERVHNHYEDGTDGVVYERVLCD